VVLDWEVALNATRPTKIVKANMNKNQRMTRKVITLYERKSLDDNPKKRKGSPRCRFTEQEKQALIQGVHQFGEGNWSKIKAGSNGALSLRSAVEVKDLYQTMKTTNH
jgi:hypothetical protein